MFCFFLDLAGSRSASPELVRTCALGTHDLDFRRPEISGGARAELQVRGVLQIAGRDSAEPDYASIGAFSTSDWSN